MASAIFIPLSSIHPALSSKWGGMSELYKIYDLSGSNELDEIKRADQTGWNARNEMHRFQIANVFLFQMKFKFYHELQNDSINGLSS